MKRIVFAIVIVLLYALFALLYSFSPVRSFFLALNQVWLNSVYSNLDQFFSFVWFRSLSGVLSVGSSMDNPQMYGAVLSGLMAAVLLILVEIPASLISSGRKKSRAKFAEEVKSEKAKLEDTNQAPELAADPNSKSNVSAPFVSLDKPLAAGEDYSAKVSLGKKKSAPAVRIALSVIFGFGLLFFLFLRFVYQVQLSPVYGAFSGLFSTAFMQAWMKNLDGFFSSLFAQLYHKAMMTVQSASWTVGQFLELLILFLFSGLIWAIILLICHYVVKSYRKKRRVHETVGSDANLLEKGKGNNPFEAKADISTVAEIKPFSQGPNSLESKSQKEAYIEDIGADVRNAGQAEKVTVKVAPSPVRQALTPENMGEDLSGNKAVKVTDIASIEDTVKKSSSSSVKVDSFVMPEDNVANIDLENVNLKAAVKYDPRPANQASQVKKDDSIAFDEDGYAYLVKEGKPSDANLEDISDVISEDSLDQKMAVSRYGKENFDVLNKLEPFKLKPLVFGEEINHIKNRRELEDLEDSENQLEEALSEPPFEHVLNGDEKFEKEEMLPKEEKTAPAAPAPVNLENLGEGLSYEVQPCSQHLFDKALMDEENKPELFRDDILILRPFDENEPKEKPAEEKAFEEFEKREFAPIYNQELANEYNAADFFKSAEKKEAPAPINKPEKPLAPVAGNLPAPKAEEAKPAEEKKPEEKKPEEKQPEKVSLAPFAKPSTPIGIKPIKTIVAQPLNSQEHFNPVKPAPAPVKPKENAAEEANKNGPRPIMPLSLKASSRPSKPSSPIRPQHVTADQFASSAQAASASSGNAVPSASAFASVKPLASGVTRHIVPAFNKPKAPLQPRAVSTAGLLTPHPSLAPAASSAPYKKPDFVQPLNPFASKPATSAKREIRPLDPKAVSSTNGLDMHKSQAPANPSPAVEKVAPLTPELPPSSSPEAKPQPINVKSVTIEEYLGRSKNKK